MNGKLRLLLLLLVLAGTTTACVSRRGRTGNAYPPVRIHVQNLNFYDATIYAVWRTDRRRLGVVNGNDEKSFTSAWHAPDLTFEVELLAGSRYRSATIGVSPDDDVILEIPSANVNALRVYRRSP